MFGFVGRCLGLWVDGHFTINGLVCGQDEESAISSYKFFVLVQAANSVIPSSWLMYLDMEVK